MLSRNEHEKYQKIFPNKWQDEINKLLYSTYKSYCMRDQKEFEAFGMTFPDELVIIASYLDKLHPELAPVTVFTSVDLTPNIDVSKLTGTLLDTIGLIFDDYFTNDDWNNYQTKWQQIQAKNIHYKITRENVGLTIEANKILGI